jgi:hypothetical protein
MQTKAPSDHGRHLESGQSMPSRERYAPISGVSAVSREKPHDPAASVRQKLFNRAQQRHEDFGLVLTKYGLERFLY